MDTYYDTGLLLQLYFGGEQAEALDQYVARRRSAIPVSGFEELEMTNAMQLKLFRGEITTAALAGVAHHVKDDFDLGRLVRRPVAWPEAFAEAMRLSGAVSAATGCRTLDILHLATARLWGCTRFVSTDARQIRAAKRVGLKIVDLRPRTR